MPNFPGLDLLDKTVRPGGGWMTTRIFHYFLQMGKQHVVLRLIWVQRRYEFWWVREGVGAPEVFCTADLSATLCGTASNSMQGYLLFKNTIAGHIVRMSIREGILSNAPDFVKSIANVRIGENTPTHFSEKWRARVSPPTRPKKWDGGESSLFPPILATNRETKVLFTQVKGTRV